MKAALIPTTKAIPKPNAMKNKAGDDFGPLPSVLFVEDVGETIAFVGRDDEGGVFGGLE